MHVSRPSEILEKEPGTTRIIFWSESNYYHGSLFLNTALHIVNVLRGKDFRTTVGLFDLGAI